MMKRHGNGKGRSMMCVSIDNPLNRKQIANNYYATRVYDRGKNYDYVSITVSI